MIRQFANDMDIYHGLSHELPIGISAAKVKSVVTINDLIYHHYPKDFPWFDRKMYAFKCQYACRHADHIIAISESTKRDVEQILGIEESKISVIYPTIDPSFEKVPDTDSIKSVLKKHQLPPEFCLYSGGLLARKNLLNVLKAYGSIPKADRISMALLVSGNDRKGRVDKWIDDLGIQATTINLGYVESKDLPALYNQACFTIYPSKYEGFGLPIVESLMMQTPIITSNVSSMPEAAGDGALYVNPDSVTDIRNKMHELMKNSGLRKELVTNGQKHLHQFDGKLSARKTLDLYKQIL